MVHTSHPFRLIVLFAALTLFLSGLPLQEASASTASSKTKQSTATKSGASSARKKASTARTKGNSSTRTASSSNAQSAKKSTVRKQNASSIGTSANAKKKTSRRGKSSARRSSSASRGPYKGAVVFNASTGQMLFSRNPNRQVPPASLTKVLSMFVAEDAIRARNIRPNTLVTVSPRAAAAGGSRMGLRAYDKVPLEDLLHGMAVSSGNDASVAVAEYIGGSESKFVQMMNRKARSLGMSRSTFINSNGLPAPGQYTTAKDMLALARAYLAAYPSNLQKHHNQTFNSYKGNLTSNANPLLRSFPGADGLKTGFVSAAGYNLIATAQRNGQRVIGVILGAPTSASRATAACSLMEACFTSPATLTAQSTPADLAEAGGRVSASKSKNQSLQASAPDASSSKPQDGKRASGKSKASASSKKGKKAAGSSTKNTADKTRKAQKMS